MKRYAKMEYFRRLGRNQSGQDLIEYALIGAFIAVSVAVAVPPAVTAVSTALSAIITSLNATATALTDS